MIICLWNQVCRQVQETLARMCPRGRTFLLRDTADPADWKMRGVGPTCLQALGTLSCIALVVILRFRGDTISDTLDGHSREACLEKFWDFFGCFLWIFRWIWQSHGDNKMQQQQARKMMNTQCIQKLWPLTRLAHTTMSYTSKSTATYSTLLAGQSIHMICYTYILFIYNIYIHITSTM